MFDIIENVTAWIIGIIIIIVMAIFFLIPVYYDIDITLPKEIKDFQDLQKVNLKLEKVKDDNKVEVFYK